MAPSTYSFYRCYLQVGGAKYVRMYSESYTLLTTGIEGTCTLSDIDDQYYCGAASCSECEQY